MMNAIKSRDERALWRGNDSDRFLLLLKRKILTITSLSLLSPVTHFLVKVRLVQPFAALPDSRGQSWLGSMGGSA